MCRTALHELLEVEDRTVIVLLQCVQRGCIREVGWEVEGEDDWPPRRCGLSTEDRRDSYTHFVYEVQGCQSTPMPTELHPSGMIPRAKPSGRTAHLMEHELCKHDSRLLVVGIVFQEDHALLLARVHVARGQVQLQG